MKTNRVRTRKVFATYEIKGKEYENETHTLTLAYTA